MDLEKLKSKKTTLELLQFGIINLDKSTGPTSFWTSQFVKRSLALKKTSHFGTLDPQVTGVLPVALNRACRLNEYLMHRNKTYVGIIRLHKSISLSVLKKEMSEFLGDITQLPPLRSRVKRAPRVRKINSFEILEKKGKDVLFMSNVQAGTYIRKLIHDLGLKIGGAHMLELRRTNAGLFSEETLVNLYEFEKAVKDYKSGKDSNLREMIIPGEIVTTLYPCVEIKSDFLKKALTGSPIFSKELEKECSHDKGEIVCILSKEKFIGCYRVVNSEEVFAVPELVCN